MSALKYKIFVINLERSPARLEAIAAQLKGFDLPFERIAAFDGSKMSDDEVRQAAPPEKVASTYHRQLGKGEVGCGLSHRAAWQQIIEQDLDFAIVLEDDIELKANFADAVSLVAELPKGSWDFLKFFPLSRGSEKNIDQSFEYQDFTFVTYHKFPLGCQGQAISRYAAEKMVSNMPLILEPVDGQLKAWWELDIYPFGLLPYCVHSELGGQSDINPGSKLEQMPQNKGRKIWNKIKKGVARMYYHPKLNEHFKCFQQALQTKSSSG